MNDTSTANSRRTTVWRDQSQHVPSGTVLLACSACAAAIPSYNAQRHADWHNGSSHAQG